MFDFNKLDSYKAAIDDGFIYDYEVSEIEHLLFYKEKDGLYRFVISDLMSITEVCNIMTSNYEKLKEMVAEVFLGVEDK
ncbi:hypothetical protein [Cetobacterium sp.]|uniref:hypothetical protein n=1 Tax=Cetobacterium sp. TaxID=2071632 RepID=UPI003EE50931